MKNLRYLPAFFLLALLMAAAAFSAHAEQASSQHSVTQAKDNGIGAAAIVATATRKATPTNTAAEDSEKVDTMTLLAQKARTEHSERPDDFEEPESLDDIVEPEDDSWRALLPGRDTEFETYDGVRISEAGQALLDLGDLMTLILKRDTVTQFVPDNLAQEELDRISVDFGKTPLLQRIVLALHLSRGGFLGEKSTESGPIALSTPNAVVIVSGTTFFLVYDPDADTTWVGNFEGTIDVADVAEEEGDDLADSTLIAIPPVRDRAEWPIHEHLTFDEFDRLIDVLESPIAAADMISGPYLVGQFEPRLNVRRGPGTEFGIAGVLAEGDYARIIGKGRGWWQIECPKTTYTQGVDCWVAGSGAYTHAYNTEDVPVSALPATPVPTAIPTKAPATPQAPAAQTSNASQPAADPNADVTNCSYIGNSRFRFDTAVEKGVEGTWRPGCPGDPLITIRPCTVSWEARSNNVKSAVIRYEIDGTAYDGEEQYKDSGQFTPQNLEGSTSFSLPYQFEGEVRAYFDALLDNGVKDTKKASRYFTNECYQEGQVFEYPQ